MPVSAINKGSKISLGTFDDTMYEVLHVFTQERVLIDFQGLVVLAELRPNGVWEQSGDPATPEENVVILDLVAYMRDKTVVKVEPSGT